MVVALVPAQASTSIDGSIRIPMAEAPAAPVPVPAWDPESPQKLVLIEGKLYQEDVGFYYPVVDDHVTVRLGDGVRSWSDLVQRAVAAAPGRFGILEALDVRRVNKLGIVDLEIRDGSVTDWAALIHETGLARYAEVAAIGEYTATANDQFYDNQWALHNTGQTGGTAGADMEAEAAWDITTGNPSVIIGVLDSGTLVTHPDLAPNVWINTGEIPNNGQDDDGNGFVDDDRGWDFGNGNNNPISNSFHGTHVTGVINAAGNNTIGVAGLGGGLDSPGLLGMALAVGDSFPIGSILDDAIIYATDNGAAVITMSLSVGTSQAINDALSYAYNQNDVFVDCAAGNNGSNVSYPANRPEVMAVASTDHNDNRSGFSNPGSALEIAAPGSNIWSTQLGNSYGSSSGTSFAAPYVGALAGLIRGMAPGFTAPEVRQHIIDTSEDVESPGFDNLTGWGRINAFQAVSQLGSSDGTVELDVEMYSCNDSLTVTAADFDLAGTGTLNVTVRSDSEPGGETVLLTETGFAVFTGTIQVSDSEGLGTLLVTHDESITAEYLDADDGQGGVNVVKTDTATTDCVGPAISNVMTTAIDDQSATVTWNTDEAGTSIVRYGTELPLDQETAAGPSSINHIMPINDLESCTIYLYAVETTDPLGNVTVDDNGGEYYSFLTQGNFPGIGVGPCQFGTALLDRTVYGCTSTAVATVTDIDLDLDSGGTDLAQVLMTSTTEPDGEWITLTELDFGVFEGGIDLTADPVADDGLLSTSPGDLVTVTYFDADDGQGQARVASATATVDCLGPAIQDVQVTAISSTRAEIQWTTSEPATSRVEFGADASLGSMAEDVELKTAHRMAISAFEACDRVFFRVSGADENGDVMVAGAGAEPFEFNLNQIGGLVFHDNFETDDGWEVSGEWERATAQGLSGDPATGYSGVGIMGVDVTGLGAFPGNYEPGAADWIFSPSLNTVGLSNLELILRRKLGIAPGDVARIGLRNIFLQNVWTSSQQIDDADWVEVRYPIPGASGQTSVQVGFGLNAVSGSSRYGWNIDEVIVKDSTQPDYLVCGGCTGAPTFAGLLAAYDPSPCGASGVTLEWNAAPAWGSGSAGTYDVYRGTTSDFIPDVSNRVATALTSTVWVDDTVPADTPVWYVVRARNDEDCGAGEGLADANLVRLPVIETADQPVPPPVGESVRVTNVGSAHVRLTWDAVPGVEEYVVRRSTSPAFDTSEIVGVTPGTLFEDVSVAADGMFYTYRVFAVNGCGIEGP